MSKEHLFPPEPVPRLRSPAGQALVVMVACLLVASLLNADRLDRTAHTQPFGWQRTWAVRLTGPLQALSHLTLANRPRRSLAEAAGNVDPPPPIDTESVVTAPPVIADTTTTAPPPLRTPTAAEPLRILVLGDSLMIEIAPQLEQALDGRPVDVREDYQAATGLARPDVINWPARVADDMEAHDPEVVVVGFGGNDAQDMATDDGRLARYSPEWAAEYQRRVAQVLNAIEQPGRTVYWIGLPVTTVTNIERAGPDMRRAIRREVAARPWAHFVDSRETLSPDGVYAAYLPDGSGNPVKVRQDDGVHANPAGAARVVAPIAEAVAAERRLG